MSSLLHPRSRLLIVLACFLSQTHGFMSSGVPYVKRTSSIEYSNDTGDKKIVSPVKFNASVTDIFKNDDSSMNIPNGDIATKYMKATRAGIFFEDKERMGKKNERGRESTNGRKLENESSEEKRVFERLRNAQR